VIGSAGCGVGMAPGSVGHTLVAEAGWRTGEGGRARATVCGVANRWGQAATGSGVYGGVQGERGKRGSAVAGRRQAGPTSTVPGGVV
jgi:hypothetical protein